MDMDHLSAQSECRAQALHCRMVADTATDEEVRTLWVSMAQTWTKLKRWSGYSRIKGRVMRMVKAQNKRKSRLEAAKPLSIGSEPITKTIGIVVVAVFADAPLGCFLSWRLRLCRKLKHRCLVTLEQICPAAPDRRFDRWRMCGV
jgi:hypothetical protein